MMRYYAISGLCVFVALATGALLFNTQNEHERGSLLDLTGVMIGVLIVEPTMVVFHEFAHAFTGWALGLRLFGITLGSGPRVWRWRGDTFFIDIHAVPAGGLCWVAPRTDRVSRWRRAIMVGAGPMVHALALLALCLGGSALFQFAPRFAFGFWLVFLGINFIMLLGNLIPRDIQRDGQRYWNDGKNLFHLLSAKYDDSQWIAARYAMEIEACLEMGRVADARHWLEGGRPLAQDTLSFRIIELHVLASEANWPEVQTRSNAGLAGASDPQERCAWAAWAAVACVYTGGDLQQAEALSDEAIAVAPWDAAVQTVRATVFLAQGRNQDAEFALNQAGFMNSDWAAKAAAAQAWAELFRRRADEPRRLKWEARAKTLDPRRIFRIPQSTMTSATKPPAEAEPAT